jgi:very-short-patch-repair endonuclease
MRHSLTPAETRLWWHLRQRSPVESFGFRRQVALGPYAADFCCPGAQPIGEVEGGQHGAPGQRAYDAARTAAREARGVRVLPFSNADAMRASDGTLDTIMAALAAAPPSPET